MYKITFKLNSPINFIDKPLFDGILAYCYMKEHYPNFERKLSYSKDELIDLSDLPIKKDNSDCFIASWMQYDKEIEFTGSWKKRWANQTDYLADFGKNKRQLRINQGEFKSYSVPLILKSIPQVWFYFDSDNVEEVNRLIDKWLWGIGKKTSQGYGEIDHFKIEKIDYNPFKDNVIRPIPISGLNLSDKEKTELMMSGKVGLHCIKPPYWLTEFAEVCLLEN